MGPEPPENRPRAPLSCIGVFQVERKDAGHVVFARAFPGRRRRLCLCPALDECDEKEKSARNTSRARRVGFPDMFGSSSRAFGPDCVEVAPAASRPVRAGRIAKSPCAMRDRRFFPTAGGLPSASLSGPNACAGPFSPLFSTVLPRSGGSEDALPTKPRPNFPFFPLAMRTSDAMLDLTFSAETPKVGSIRQRFGG